MIVFAAVLDLIIVVYDQHAIGGAVYVQLDFIRAQFVRVLESVQRVFRAIAGCAAVRGADGFMLRAVGHHRDIECGGYARRGFYGDLRRTARKSRDHAVCIHRGDGCIGDRIGVFAVRGGGHRGKRYLLARAQTDFILRTDDLIGHGQNRDRAFRHRAAARCAHGDDGGAGAHGGNGAVARYAGDAGIGAGIAEITHRVFVRIDHRKLRLRADAH